jgi:hypothetical protein
MRERTGFKEFCEKRAELIHSFLKERVHKVVRRGSDQLGITNLKLFLSLIVSVSLADVGAGTFPYSYLMNDKTAKKQDLKISEQASNQVFLY